MPAGQPTKYRPEYCEEIVEWMAKGKSLTSFAVKIKVTRETVYEWGRVHPEFSDALEKARSSRLSHFEDIGYAGMMGEIKGFNPTVWIFSMKAYFGVREDEHDDKKQPINITVNMDKDADKSDEGAK